jgi:hypothetical protein
MESTIKEAQPVKPVHRRQLTNTEKKFLPHAVTKIQINDAEEESVPVTPFEQ